MLWLALLALAWAASAVSCLRLCLAAADAPRLPGADEDAGRPGAPGRLTLPEAAFLAGGPHRVTTLALVSMHREGRLLLAHTGWTTVVDPEGGDDLERSVIGAAGPGGQERTAAVRDAVAGGAAVRRLGDRLVAQGLAVPESARSAVRSALRAVRAAGVLTVALAAGAVLSLPAGVAAGPVAAWFALPLLLTLGALAAARFEVHAYTGWASPLGAGRLTALVARAAAADDGTDADGGRARLTALAVFGVGAIEDPQLRTALDGTGAPPLPDPR